MGGPDDSLSQRVERGVRRAAGMQEQEPQGSLARWVFDVILLLGLPVLGWVLLSVIEIREVQAEDTVRDEAAAERVEGIEARQERIEERVNTTARRVERIDQKLDDLKERETEQTRQILDAIREIRKP